MFDDLNSITISGNVTRDIELKKSASGMSVGKFSVASNKSVKSGDSYEKKATFFNVVVFGKYAETLAKFVKKGSPVVVTGSLDINNYEKDGEKKTWVSILCNNVRLFKGGSGGSSSATGQDDLFGSDSGASDSDIPF